MDAPEPAPIASPRPRAPRRAGLLAALVLVQVALGAFIGFALIDQRDRARAEAFGLAEQAARAWARQVGENLRIAALTLDTLDAGDPWGQNRPGIRRVMVDFAETIPWLNTVFIADAEGRVVVTSQLRVPARSVRDEPFFRHHLTAPGGPYLAGPIADPDDGRRVLVLSRRLGPSWRVLDGVAVATLDDAFFRDLFRSVALPWRPLVRLVRADGSVLISQPELDIGGGQVSRAVLDGRLGVAGRINAVPHSDGVTRDLVVIPTGFLGTAVTVGIDPRAIDAAFWEASRAEIAAATGLFLTLGLVSVLMARALAGADEARAIIARQAQDLAAKVAELDTARTEAERANRAKSDFLASISHELRTPLNGVLGMNRLLLESGLTAQQREQAETVRDCARDLTAMIEALLDAAELETGTLTLKEAVFEPAALGEMVVGAFAEEARAKRIELALVLGEGTTEPRRGDPGRVHQVLANLVANAVRYTASGSVVVRIDGVEDLRMVVADTGPGIPPARQASVFERFAEADPARPRSRPGAGLGLAIARDLVGLMRGTLTLASLPGSGTTVTVSLPLPRQAAAHRPPPFPARVLIAEPRPASREALAASCARHGIAADAAAAAEEALQLAGLAASSRRPYDAAILAASGDAAADAALAQGLRRLGVGGVVLAGASDRADGADATLALPASRTAIRAALEVCIGGKARSAPALPRQGRVLVAEDNSVSRTLLQRLLERAGWRVTTAEDGARTVHAAEHDGPFDVVLMDVQMPVMDGIAATRAIRALGGAAGLVPIVAVTAFALPSDRDRCLSAGMDGFLTKPVDPDALFAVLERLTGISATTAASR
ncbi:response regulator [Elioraea tepidiphila]|jgi:signal transduction histidine kinase/DNA-binding response OmpR family regulator|uniref:hybrid sensor histidine kinase/response regulator n=1 Tax=Elioraea tepidiphila TaxID=457934 RepID=UPI002FD87C8C